MLSYGAGAYQWLREPKSEQPGLKTQMQAMKSARQYRRRVRGRAQRLRLKSVSISRIRPGGRHRPENIPHVLGISLQVFPLPHRMLPFRDNSP
ncbi:MAG TPA: hypothetical protein VHU84_19635, partial [Lacipirellulaceae bacterium]|nr:hypothetical protein [Lacipirellulaceae bacterium]